MKHLKSDFLRFLEDKDPKYYSQLAKACDSILAKNPLGTNAFIRILGANASLPEMVQDLNPNRVTISSNRVHIMVGESRAGYAVVWEFDETVTNAWVLSVISEGPQRIVYTEKRER